MEVGIAHSVTTQNPLGIEDSPCRNTLPEPWGGGSSEAVERALCLHLRERKVRAFPAQELATLLAERRVPCDEPRGIDKKIRGNDAIEMADRAASISLETRAQLVFLFAGAAVHQAGLAMAAAMASG